MLRPTCERWLEIADIHAVQVAVEGGFGDLEDLRSEAVSVQDDEGRPWSPQGSQVRLREVRRSDKDAHLACGKIGRQRPRRSQGGLGLSSRDGHDAERC